MRPGRRVRQESVLVFEKGDAHVLRSHGKTPFSGPLRIFCAPGICLRGKDWSVIVNQKN